jgi:flavin-dependent dehydrogenase
MLLAREGWRVLLVDKSTFPSDIMSTHYIHISGVARLSRWGLLDEVRNSNCPPINKLTLDFGAFKLSGSPPPAGEISEGYSPRRKVLDKILVDAAVRSGAEMREGFTVQEIIKDGDRVTGIRGKTRGGSAVTEEARIVIGADGPHSIVARSVQAPTYNERPSLTCGYYSYWSNVPVDGAELYLRDRRAIITFPTNDGQTLIIIQWPNEEFDKVRADIEGNFLKELELAPSLAERARAGRREERFVGTADVPNFFRKPYGEGWALVGDAGYHKDPHTAQGISDSFRDAELLSRAIAAGFSGRLPVQKALEDYEQARNEAAMPLYELTCQRATLDPPPAEVMQLLQALCGNQRQTDRFIGLDAGTVKVSDFFSPQNIGEIMEAASAARNSS